MVTATFNSLQVGTFQLNMLFVVHVVHNAVEMESVETGTRLKLQPELD